MRFSKLILCLTLLLACSPAGFAQKKALCPVPPPSPYKHNARIVTGFDSRTNLMRTTLEHPRAISRGNASVYLSAAFVHRDPRRPVKPTLDVAFARSSPAPHALRSRDLALVCDGKSAAFIGAARFQSRRDEHGMAQEAAIVTLSYEELLNVTRAQKVVARLGGEEFELTKNHLEALRELASLMGPPPSRWRVAD
jgi:GGDEF domain-containing protein